MWSSRQKMGYMSLTAHWIDNDWNMQKRILSFKMVEYPHTGESLAAHAYEELIAWHLHDKVFTLTLDNASSNDVLVSRLACHLMLSNATNQLFHVRCTCHILNLIVQDGLFVLSPSIEKITTIVSHIDIEIKVASVRAVLHQLYDTYKRNMLAACMPAACNNMPAASDALEPEIDVNIPVVPSASMAKLKRTTCPPRQHFLQEVELYQKKRASVSPNTIEALIYLKNWSLASSRKQDAAVEEYAAEELMNARASQPDWLLDGAELPETVSDNSAESGEENPVTVLSDA
ncbi:hypothetical protein QQ045_028295 [Rhodiola kirilowii]